MKKTMACNTIAVRWRNVLYPPLSTNGLNSTVILREDCSQQYSKVIVSINIKKVYIFHNTIMQT